MELYLMRHGEALSKQDAGVAADAERPLSPAGSEAVQRVAQHFTAAGVRPDRLLTSPLRRARETAELLAECLGCQDRLAVCQALHPDQVPPAFLEAMRQLHAEGILVAVGHQPLLGHLATQLVFGSPQDGITLEPGGVCVVDVPEFPRSLVGLLRGLWNPERSNELTRRSP